MTADPDPRRLPRSPYGVDCAAWRALHRHADRLQSASAADLTDPGRAARFTREAAGLYLDFTRQRLDGPALDDLLALAGEAGVREWTRALFEGRHVNTTEDRPALHVALRRPANRPLQVAGADVMPEVDAVRRRMAELVRRVHDGELTGADGRAITDVVNVGIGGSDLGIVMAVRALHAWRRPGLGVHFVSNVDGVQAADLMAALDPATTLFVVCSKSFTTQETRVNAETLRAWLVERCGEAAVSRQFIAVSTNAAAMDVFGIAPELRLTMWDWVGGRYSLWSAVGLTIALAIGWPAFERLLAGAHAMDEHFESAAPGDSLPVLLALLGVWNQNFLGVQSHAVLPYDQRLERLPAFLQQLDMESNGKRVTRDGRPVGWDTGAVLWGEPGTNAQHSFCQLLHQGTREAAVEFVAPVRGCGPQAQHDLALANLLAQAEALWHGHGETDAAAELAARGVPEQARAALVPHRVHPGGRPSTLVLFERLDPAALGALVALHEHRVFVQSVLWGINAFDQWGVELGKRLAAGTEGWITGRESAPAHAPAALEAIRRWRPTD